MSTIRMINALLLVSTVAGLTGCSGLGRFGHQDYASLAADPFLDSDSARRTADGSTTGFARLDDMRGSADAAVASIADTKSSGPSLSDFMGQSSRTVATNPVSSPGLMTAAAETLAATHDEASAIASAAGDDFIDWANAQDNAVRQASAQVQNNVRNTVETADSRVRHTAAELQSSISEFPGAIANAPAAAGEFFDEEIAEPLIRGRLPDPATVRSRIADGNPFAEIERQQQVSRKKVHPTATLKAASAQPTSQMKSPQDEPAQRFLENSGWRPSNFEFP